MPPSNAARSSGDHAAVARWRHEQALANGTLKQDFEDEIAKSWKEYVEQVGEEMATQNPFWADALNDVLARGQKIF